MGTRVNVGYFGCIKFFFVFICKDIRGTFCSTGAQRSAGSLFFIPES